MLQSLLNKLLAIYIRDTRLIITPCLSTLSELRDEIEVSKITPR